MPEEEGILDREIAERVLGLPECRNESRVWICVPELGGGDREILEELGHKNTSSVFRKLPGRRWSFVTESSRISRKVISYHGTKERMPKSG